jgi:hypothetical protein
MPVLPPSCRCPCRLSRLLAGGLAVATDGQGRSPAGLGPGHQGLPSNGHEGGTVTITYSDRVHRSLCCKSPPADYGRPEPGVSGIPVRQQNIKFCAGGIGQGRPLIAACPDVREHLD